VRRNLAKGEGEPLHGYLNVLKPPSMTSFDVVSRVRAITRQRRVGHAGTLDPAAIGVLPVAIGRATPTLSSPLWDCKLYWADVQFGTATDTDDAEGRPVGFGSPQTITSESIVSALPQFLGDI
jgi:tRNA pseudouridine55 synthase